VFVQDMPAAFMAVRASTWGQVQAACNALQGSSASLPYTAMFLLDQAAAAGLFLSTAAAAFSANGALQPAWVAAALVAASEAGQASMSACTLPTPGLAGATGSTGGSGAPAATPLAESAVAAHFEIATDALQAALQAALGTLREGCAAACATPVTAYMMLDLFLQVLSSGRLDYKVCGKLLALRQCRCLLPLHYWGRDVIG
jgi:hypothetical protein